MSFLFSNLFSKKRDAALRRGVVWMWTYRKELMGLGYLFLIGMGFGAVWFFSTSHNPHRTTERQGLAFEEDHRPLAVEVDIVERATVNPEIRREPLQTDALPETEAQAPSAKVAGAVAWRDNAVKVTGGAGVEISIVIDDLGIVKGRTLDIIKLNAPLTLSFLPYAPNLPTVTQVARGRGHELMVHLPMEPKGHSDPGPHALLTGETKAQIRADLQFNLTRFEGYVGLNNHMGSAFTENRAGLDVVLAEVQRRGMLVLDSRTSGKSLLAKMATGRNIPNMTRDIFLDNEQDVTYILGQLEKLESLARRKGKAIAIGHPYQETIEALSRWMPTLAEKGITIVPLSHLMRQKYAVPLLAKHQNTDPAS